MGVINRRAKDAHEPSTSSQRTPLADLARPRPTSPDLARSRPISPDLACDRRAKDTPLSAMAPLLWLLARVPASRAKKVISPELP